MLSKDKITIELSNKEALVLWAFLHRFDDEDNYSFADQADQRVLWDLEILLQPQLPEITSPDYGKFLKDAREQIRDIDESPNFPQ
ncbi:MAG: hypothetical protein GTO02_15255 [Candidatus Dadabacteria bacterium]|nr:hypothetical protein [Candidatus Dadabacteria bacterium]